MMEQKNESIKFLTNKLIDDETSYFDEFYEMTKRQVFSIIVKTTDSFTDAEDILQDTYLYFLNNRNKLKRDTNPLNYLLLIGRHLAIDFLRKNKRLINYDDLSFFEDEDKITFEETPLLNYLKKRYSKEDLEIITLHVINELPFKEIAKLKDKPLGTILWKYNKIIKEVRKEVNEDDYK